MSQVLFDSQRRQSRGTVMIPAFLHYFHNTNHNLKAKNWHIIIIFCILNYTFYIETSSFFIAIVSRTAKRVHRHIGKTERWGLIWAKLAEIYKAWISTVEYSAYLSLWGHRLVQLLDLEALGQLVQQRLFHEETTVLPEPQFYFEHFPCKTTCTRLTLGYLLNIRQTQLCYPPPPDLSCKSANAWNSR